MTDSSDMDVFDSITSGAGEPDTPIIETKQEIIEPQNSPQRDDQGRFAARAEGPAPQFESASDPQPESHQSGGVPVRAIQEERDKRQAAQAEAETLRREIAELRGMVTAQRQTTTPQPQQEQQPASLWDDPDAYLKGQLNPVQQEVAQVRNMLMRFEATQTHGADKVQAAFDAIKAIGDTQQGEMIARQIMETGNPFDNMVKWHQQQQVMSRIGNDPDAWLNAELEKRMADPAFQAQVIERARGGAVQNGNRSQQPVTSIPPSLSRIPAGGNIAATEQESDAGLFASLTSGRR